MKAGEMAAGGAIGENKCGVINLFEARIENMAYQ
jgi:hypothetical protein